MESGPGYFSTLELGVGLQNFSTDDATTPRVEDRKINIGVL